MCGKRFRLIDLEIGHALKNDGSFWPNSFSLKEAVVRLRSLERDPAI